MDFPVFLRKGVKPLEENGEHYGGVLVKQDMPCRFCVQQRGGEKLRKAARRSIGTSTSLIRQHVHSKAQPTNIMQYYKQDSATFRYVYAYILLLDKETVVGLVCNSSYCRVPNIPVFDLLEHQKCSTNLVQHLRNRQINKKNLVG
ncbi:hypothetical protein EJB05_52218, partial [Eragrostis curvula]